MPGSGVGWPRLDLGLYRDDITVLWECGVTLADIVDTINSDEQLDVSVSLSTLRRALKEWGLQRKVNSSRAEVEYTALIKIGTFSSRDQ